MIEAANESVHVCVVADHPLVKRYLAGLLRKDQRISLLPFARLASLPSATKGPDVFLLDATVLAGHIESRIRGLRLGFPRSRFVLVGPVITDEEVARNIFMGIHGYVTYEDVERRLGDSILSVSRGHLALSGQAIQIYITASSRTLGERAQADSAVTDREREVIELVVRRLSNKEIAASLGIAESTVKFHLSRVFAKLKVTGRWDLEQKIRLQEETYRYRQDNGQQLSDPMQGSVKSSMKEA
jgi:DNA-binding NarL/FixJ family response regulator